MTVAFTPAATSLTAGGAGLTAAATGLTTAASALLAAAAALAAAGGGNAAGGIAKFGSELVGKFATGGYVRGPGTATSDSIPARLSDREFVQPAHAVAHYGVAFMEGLRRRAIPKETMRAVLSGVRLPALRVHAPRVPAFATGGLVQRELLTDTIARGATSPAGGGTLEGELRLGLDEGLLLRHSKTYLRSRDGTAEVLRIVAENRRTLGLP